MPNTYDLSGKSAIVTGAAKGIGRAIAELFLSNGCDVTIWDVSPSRVAGAKSLQLDVTQSSDVAAAIAQLPASQRIDILVNCAGYLGKAISFVDHISADWRRILEVNLIGTLGPLPPLRSTSQGDRHASSRARVPASRFPFSARGVCCRTTR